MQKKTQFRDELVEEVKQDFFRRREERRALELQWNLNINYLIGNQYCEITPSGEVEEEGKSFYWQNRNVYNHIAPIIETRTAKLSRVRPVMSVRAQGSEDNDIKTAKIATNVLNSTFQRLSLDSVISKATLWSEVFGTSFYKIMWNSDEGKSIAYGDDEVCEGDVEIIALSPFEIYPDSLFHDDIDGLKSLIHARAMNVKDIEEIYGVNVQGGDVDVFKMETVSSANGRNRITSGIVHDNAVVIERYERPCREFPNGRIVTIAGDSLLCVTDLPYLNGIDGKRDFPFIKQVSIVQPSCFFGLSIVERMIPIQRTYNAIKNRKLEFINRLSMGIIAVEDGSIDTDELVAEGLSPGKVIVYRQGSNPPQMMPTGNIPSELTYEEERLIREFITISGVSEISRSSSVPDAVMSGVALQVLIEQDETRLSSTAEAVRRAVRAVAKHIIRLFKQFSGQMRIMKIAGESKKAEVFYFSSSELTSDDVVFDTENEISTTPAQKKSAVLELFANGLLSDRNGMVDERTKAKILEIMGFGSLENANDLTNLHMSKADLENIDIAKKNIAAEEFDDHDIHITQHTRFLISGELSDRDGKELKEKIIAHIKDHKTQKMNNSRAIDTLSNKIATETPIEDEVIAYRK